jgi:hypothetical protein
MRSFYKNGKQKFTLGDFLELGTGAQNALQMTRKLRHGLNTL